MKTKYLFIFLLFSVFGTAQVLESDNYESYGLGDMTFISGGSYYTVGGMIIQPITPFSNSQIVSVDDSHGKFMQLKNDPSLSNFESVQRTVFKSNTSSFCVKWANRTPGNNIVKVTYDLYTGGYTADNPDSFFKNLVGTHHFVGLYYNMSTQKFHLYARIKEGIYTNYRYIELPSPTIPNNTWVSVGYTFNTETMDFTYTINGVTSTWTPPSGQTIQMPDLGIPCFAICTRFIGLQAGPSVFAIDNYVVEAVATLSTSDIETDSVEISISPNPTKGIFSVNSKNREDIFIYNSSGRLLKKEILKTGDNKIDISAFSTGVYFLKKGNKTYKLIKE